MRENRERNLAAVALICSLVFTMLSLFASTNYANREQPIRLHFLFLGLGVLLWGIGHYLLMRSGSVRELRQLVLLDIGIGVVFSLLAIIGKDQLQEVGREKYLISYGMIIFGCFIAFLICCRQRNLVHINKEDGKRWISERKYIAIVLFACAVIAVIQSDSEPRWDASYLFQYIDDLCLAHIFNLETLSFCDHICMSYTGINEILRVMVGSQQLGMTIGTIVLLLMSIYSVWGIIRLIFKDRKEWEYALLTACYAVSPFILGLAGYNYWDYWMMMLYPVVIYSAMKDRWIFHFFAALTMCFVKEPAVVAYGAYCAGYVIVDYWRHKKVRYIMCQRKYWGMLAVGLIWLYTYKIMPHWNGVGGFALNIYYIWKKSKVLFLLNFNWILVLLNIIAIVWIVKKKDRVSEQVVPILISDFFFVVFSITFQTVNHARYIDTHIVALNLFAILGIAMISSEKIRYGVLMSVIILMTISNYYTLDPITHLVFKQYDVGNTEMVSTEEWEYLSDSMVYNQQYRYFDKALDLAMEDIIDEDAMNCFPVVNGRVWFFEGIYIYAEPDEPQIQYWDQKHRKRVLQENKNCVPFELCNITEETDIRSLLADGVGYYYYIPCAGQDIAEKLSQETEILEEKESSYMGWTVSRIKFMAK